MSRSWRSEAGAAMILALLALTLMSLMGMIVLRILNQGFVHTSSAEARIHAEMLAQVGIDEVNAIVQSAVKTGNQNTDYRGKVTNTVDNIKHALEAISGTAISSFPTTVEYEVETNQGTYKVEITSQVISNPNDKDLIAYVPDYPYVQEIKVTSTGESRRFRPGVRVSKEMTIYVSTINPVFRYPISADGELILNGASHIVGNVYVDNLNNASGNVTISNKARFITNINQQHTIQSGTASMEGFIQAAGKYMVEDQYGNMRERDFEREFFQHRKPFSDEYLTPAEVIDVEETVANIIGNTDLINEMITQIADSRSRSPDGFGAEIIGNGTTINNGIHFRSVWVEAQGDLVVKGNLLIEDGTLFMSSGANVVFEPISDSKSSLYVKYDDPNLIAAYLTGNLSVPDGEFVAIDGNVIMNNLNFKGTMFVNGQLKIIGDLNIEGSVYVVGDIEMKEMNSINEQVSEDAASVVLVSWGKIILSDNLTDPDAASRIRAFLYSASDDMDLYGVISKLEIIGGVHGRKVTLNAVRGESSKESRPGLIVHPSGYYFDADQDSLMSVDGNGNRTIRSRLQVKQDLSLYTNPPIGIPITEEVNLFIQEITYK